jgi:hypothetical protein
MDAGMRQHHSIQIVESALQPLSQRIPAERTEHAENMRLGNILGLMAPQNSGREHIGGDQNLLGHIGAEGANDLSAGALLPLLGIGMAALVPLFEFLNHAKSPLKSENYQTI